MQRFYEGVAADPELRALYPESDLGPAEVRLRMFLEQYWGGPTTYSEQRGHPRLRMRHAPFEVTPAQRDRWLTHMRAAVDSLDLTPEYAHELWSYLERAALLDGEHLRRAARGTRAPGLAVLPRGSAPRVDDRLQRVGSFFAICNASATSARPNRDVTNPSRSTAPEAARAMAAG